MEILVYGVQHDEQPLLEKAVAGRHTLRYLEVFLDEDTAPLAAGYRVVSTGVNARLDAPVLRRLADGGTRMIAQRATGFNNIDLAVAEELGFTVGRVAHYSPHAVAEFAWALALAVNRGVVRAANRTREFDFRLTGLMGRDIHGMTVGVIGTGKIGTVFTRIAHGFGCRLFGRDVTENPACLALGLRYVELDQLLAEADLISLHVPLVPGTHHLVDTHALARMKDDAILINTGRGGLIDAHALVETLRAGRLQGVGLDVYEEEAGLFHLDRSVGGIADDTLARLMTFPQVIVSSHQAYFTRTAVRQIADTTIGNIDDYLAGRTNENTLVPGPGSARPARPARR